MENSLISDVALDDTFFNFHYNLKYIIYGALSLIITAVVVFILSIFIKKLRRKFPVKVNCWFCNENSTVPYDFSNSWDCPHCKQYNGFSKDGDYNKIIPEQFNAKLNEGVSKALKASVKGRENIIQSNGFCKLCNINQQLKIQQLALFVPLNENSYYEEIEQYREKLEKAYQLCSKCETTLKQTLEKQEYNLLQNRLNSHKTNSFLEKSKNLSQFDRNDILLIIKKNGMSGLKLVTSGLAIILFIALVINFETEYQFLKLPPPDVGFLEPFLPILKVLLLLKDKICYFKKELSFAGLLSCFLIFFENQMKRNLMVLFTWGFLHLSCWSTFNGLQALLSGLCFLLSTKRAQRKFVFVNKKSSFQPVKTVFPEIYNNNLREESEQTNKIRSSLIRSDSIASLNECSDFENNKVKESKQTLKKMSDCDEKKKKARRRENEIESFVNEEKEMTGSNSSPNSSFTHQPFVVSAEAEKPHSESNEPFNEVFNNLSSLQLGTQKKSAKPPNFLFANHNFSETKSPIIKPAKFIKNLNSNSWTESNECNSRSSTPSSGYSSQKPEKMEPNRNDFPKSMTPFFMNPFGRQSPNNYYDYFDGNHGFYNNCFSPGFIPFQQYPGPLGHTAVYTSTRPTNFPFFFPPWQGYSPQKFSPSSSRFSDASDCDNLFQESSKRFEKNQKLFKFKTVLYYFSIFCNFITIVSLAYFISTGVILVDWKLPKFNFFI